MKYSIFSPAQLWRAGSVPVKRALLSVLAVMIISGGAVAQGPVTADGSDRETIRLLLQRIDQLEARVKKLEEARTDGATNRAPVSLQPAVVRQVLSQSSVPSAAVTPQATEATQATAPQQPGAASQEAEAEQQGEHPEPERMDVSKTLLRIRGFGDITLHGDDHKGDTTSFTLGQLNLFVTSDISDKFKFLSEIVFEAGPDNIYGVTRGVANTFGVDVERYLLTYSANEYFSLSAGRYHTAIGYYNTAYHHSTWLQTTTGRPLLFAFEDQGGILPIHNIGVEAHGRIPSGSLGLHYVAEVGNGRESRNPIGEEPVQNIITDKNHKAYNLALFARPTKVPGLQAGFSFYRDLQVPLAELPVSESILAAHAVYTTANFEWLNEALVIRHTPQGGHTFETPGWYSQISRRFGSYRPYFRYQYINASSNEPIFPDIGLRAGPQAGLRFDASESVALKLQYDYTALRDQHATQGLEGQIGFTF